MSAFPSAALALLTGLVLTPSAIAWAQDVPPERVSAEQRAEIDKFRKARRGAKEQGVRKRIGRYLTAAGEALDEGNPDEGREILGRLDPKRLNPLERAQVFRFMAYMDYAATDYSGAIENFQKVLDQEILPLKDEDNFRFAIAQLHASQQHWKETITALERWFVWVPEPNPLGYYLLAISYYQLDDDDHAIAAVEKAVDATPEPKEAWLQLLAALYVRKLDYASAAPVLEELVLRFPKKAYWVQLSLIYGAQENYQHSLAVQQIAHRQGLLTNDKELQRLARSYLYHNLPHPAAQVLEAGLEQGTIETDADAHELLANSWIAARDFDRSLDPLRKAAELSDAGNLYLRLGQVHMQREEWAEAVDLFARAIEKGGLNAPGNAELLLGISYYNDLRVDPARRAFLRARKHAKTRDQADSWIQHLQRESQAS